MEKALILIFIPIFFPIFFKSFFVYSLACIFFYFLIAHICMYVCPQAYPLAYLSIFFFASNEFQYLFRFFDYNFIVLLNDYFVKFFIAIILMCFPSLHCFAVEWLEVFSFSFFFCFRVPACSCAANYFFTNFNFHLNISFDV